MLIDGLNPAAGAEHGGVAAMQLGNGLWEHANFNSRLQPMAIGLATSETDSSRLPLGYDYGGTNNNGNVLTQTIAVAGPPALNVRSSAGKRDSVRGCPKSPLQAQKQLSQERQEPVAR